MNDEKSICIILNEEILYYKGVNDSNIYVKVPQNVWNQSFVYGVLGRKRGRNNLIMCKKIEARLEILNEIEENVVNISTRDTKGN